jgi:hypothetical protein
MDTLIDFIHTHENSITDDTCDFLIKLFEDNLDKVERVDNDFKPNFTQFNLTQNKDIEKKVDQVHNYLIKRVFDYKNQYYKFIDERVFPKEHAFEQFRIKKYEVGGNDMFDTHVDVLDYGSSRRFLSFMWYLNDVNDGGKTVFKDFEIKPKKGKLLIFPPLWMFPHRGEPPISNPKYILSTYLHYK